MGSRQRPFKIEFVAGNTARQIRVPVAKPCNPSSIPKTHTVEENCAKWSSDFHVVWHASLLTPTKDIQHEPAQFLKLY